MFVHAIRDLALGVFVGALSLAALEIGFRVLGVASPAAEEELSRGFDRQAEYFVLDPDKDDGSWLTQFWSFDKHQPIEIPPKGELPRLLLFGGSNTESFGVNLLRKELQNNSGEDRFEVINLGRSGFGSERVSIIFEQALERLAPDYVVIYSGHNEFVEAGFRKDLDVQWPSESVRLAASAALSTHVFQGLRSTFGSEESPGSPKHASAPEDWQAEHDKFAELTFPGTQEFLSAYKDNLDRMLDAAEDLGIRAVLSTVVYNRFSQPSSSTLSKERSLAESRDIELLMDRATSETPAIFDPMFPKTKSHRIRNTDWEKRWREGGVPGGMRAAAPEELNGMRSFEGILARLNPETPSPDFWSPRTHLLVDCLKVLNDRNPTSGQRKFGMGQIELLDEVLKIEDDHPKALFMRGIYRYWLGAEESLVRSDLEGAGAFDRAPLRGSRLTNAYVAEVAAEHPESLFFDADKVWRERHPMELVGWEWMVDECHLGYGARRLLMKDLAQAILEEWNPTDD